MRFLDLCLVQLSAVRWMGTQRSCLVNSSVQSDVRNTCSGEISPHRNYSWFVQEPVLWEEIEKISLSTPRSWMEDVDSDLSDPESEDRVTIYTNELSPTPSEMMGHKSVRPVRSCCS